MKYNVVQLLTDPPQYRITSDNCQFDFGSDRSTTAHHVCGELNRLDLDLVRTREEHSRLSVLCEERGQKLATALKRVDRANGTVQTLVTAIRESQKILADYLEPGAKLNRSQNYSNMQQTLSDLLGVLDHRDLVTLVNEIPLPPGEAQANKPTNWPTWATHLFHDGEDWQYGRLVEEKSARHWVDADKDYAATQLWTEANIIAGSLEERPQPCSGSGSQPFVEKDGQVFVNGAFIDGVTAAQILDHLRTVISDTQLGTMNTVNHFGPSKKLKRKNLKLKHRIEGLVIERDELREKLRLERH